LSSYEAYRTIIHKHLLPGLGHIPLQKLTAQQVQSFYAKKGKEGYSATRVRAVHAVLRKAVDHAVRIHLLARNVCDVVEIPHREEHEVLPLSPEQAQQLLHEVRGQRLDTLLALALTTGMRKGEILALRWHDIDLQKGSLQIRRTVKYLAGHGYIEGEPKTAKSRRKITLPDFVVEKLKQHRAMQLETRLQAGAKWVDRNIVFCNTHGGFLAPMILYRLFAKALRDAGLPP
jgi:integrase